MAMNRKVVWSEGMFLRPQHFQQQERHLKAWLEQRCAGLRPFSWGLTQLQIDEELLKQGKFALKTCAGVFPDGTPFNIPAEDPAPDPLDVPSGKKNEIIQLALPLQRNSGKEVTAPENGDPLSRYRRTEGAVKDFHTDMDSNTADIEQAELWPRLRYASDDQGAFTSIPIALLLERKDDDHLLLDRNFIPTVLHCNGAEKLVSYVHEIAGLLHQRGDALSKRLASPGAGGVGEIVDFLFLQIVNRHEPLFIHLSQLNALHPLDLYQILIQLIGDLSTITEQNHRPAALPEYQHHDLTATFSPLVIRLRQLLNWVPEARAIPIPLEEHKFGVRTATVHDPQLLESAEFILAANAQVSADKLQRNFPHQTTISTVDKLRDLVMSHTPGIRIHPLAVAPRQLPFHAGFSYFRFDKQNKLWPEIVKSGTIAMHFSGDYPGLELELWAIKE